jgi:cell division protease FtsH
VEVARIVTEAHDHARRVLTERRRTLELVAQTLLEKEVIEGDELRMLIASAELTEPSVDIRA